MNRIVITGTGTNIGKTHVTCALARALGQAKARVAAFKPIESGVEPGNSASTDAAALAAASSPELRRWLSPVYTFREPLSPHLAARYANITLSLEPVLDALRLFEENPPDWLLVELAGGLFSPLNDRESNADLILRLQAERAASTPQDPPIVLLLAPDRLGVLHDVAATTRAAAAAGVPLHGVILIAPEFPDASTGTNANELRHVTSVPLLTTVRRAPIEALATGRDLQVLLQAVASHASEA